MKRQVQHTSTPHTKANQTNEVLCESFSDYNYYQIANQFFNGWVCRTEYTKHSNLIYYALNRFYFVFCVYFILREMSQKRSAIEVQRCHIDVDEVCTLCDMLIRVFRLRMFRIEISSNSIRTALMSGSTEPIHVQVIQNVQKRPKCTVFSLCKFCRNQLILVYGAFGCSILDEVVSLFMAFGARCACTMCS